MREIEGISNLGSKRMVVLKQISLCAQLMSTQPPIHVESLRSWTDFFVLEVTFGLAFEVSVMVAQPLDALEEDLEQFFPYILHFHRTYRVCCQNSTFALQQ